MSPVSSRYIRAIYLLPGVKGGSEAKGQRVLRMQRKKRTIVVDHVVLYRCFTVVSWGHVIIVVLFCCTVVYFCVGWVKNSMVLFFSGKW